MKIKIIENFFDNEDFQKIKSVKLKTISKNQIKVYHNSITKEGIIKAECLGEDLVRQLHKKYFDKAIEILRVLNPLKIKLYDYSEFHLIETGSNYKFPIHDDTPDKLLSGVVYITPKSNSGTIFYDNKKGEGKKVIDWKINKAVFFSRVDRETWHSYEGDGKNNRIVLVYNLMTKNIKKVYEVENKNYYFGKFRYWINPFLYRLFKFTI